MSDPTSHSRPVAAHGDDPLTAQSGRARDYLRFVARLMPGRLAGTVALMALVSAAEGVAVVLLVPLLHLAGIPMRGGAVGRLGDAAGGAMAAAGIPRTLGAVLLLYVAVVWAQALLQRAESIAAYEVERSVVHALRTRLYRAVAEARWSYLSHARTSDFVHALTQEAPRVGTATSYLLFLLAQGFTGAVYLALALRVSPAVTAVALASGGLLVLLQRGTRRGAREAGRGVSAAGAEVMAAATEQIGGLKVVKSYGAERRSADAFAALSARALEMQRRAIRAYADARAGFTGGSVTLLAVVLYVALVVLRLPAAVAILLIFLFSRLVPRISSLQQGWQQLLHELPAFAAVGAVVARCEAEREEETDGAPPGEPAPEIEREVRLRGVSFAHPGREAVVRGLELAIPARRTTALVGPSGAGKTTVADLVMGLAVPEEGRVEVDGRPLEAGGLRRWREGIGYVAQDTVLFHDTVRANLLWARPGADEAALREALRAAAAEAFVDALPQGLDTPIGDRGVRLSGGERQRLALARALLRRPSLLILDEATSALDAENERRILNAIAELHGTTTILVITHRLSTVRGADAVHVLEEGRVVESGAWAELARREGGRFREMLRGEEGSAKVREYESTKVRTT